MPVCPVCFEDAESVEYATMHNHSWKNHACDGHGLCWRCLAQHVEIQLLEGRYNVRCPGAAGCSYRLVSLDVGRALDVLEREDGKEEVVGTLRLRYEQLRSDCHQHRLRELLKKSQGANEAWLLTRVQPCPRCLTLVRKETGCSHVFCRCGSDFCFPCGAPPGGCICSQMRRPGGSKVVFAAWLRSADESRVEWLWDYRGLVDDNDDDGDEEVEQERLLTTLQFYLWLASAPVPSPLKPLPEPVAVPASTAPPALVEKLPEIRWKKSERKVVAEAEPGGFPGGGLRLHLLRPGRRGRLGEVLPPRAAEAVARLCLAAPEPADGSLPRKASALERGEGLAKGWGLSARLCASSPTPAVCIRCSASAAGGAAQRGGTQAAKASPTAAGPGIRGLAKPIGFTHFETQVWVSLAHV
ncbi:unnamed protein product [Effrenium voratum]|uniref:RBR-type E3 ubiquitin transferase n=2 Tax=Effrenium voratum TaxID=2562239 RepID=A0AA36N5P5_9DINO|nr:unnamed protein product [Effrenium voratum]